jgi:hypothetical protein
MPPPMQRFLAALTIQRLRAADVRLYGTEILKAYTTKAAMWMHELKLETEAAEAEKLSAVFAQ